MVTARLFSEMLRTQSLLDKQREVLARTEFLVMQSRMLKEMGGLLKGKIGEPNAVLLGQVEESLTKTPRKELQEQNIDKEIFKAKESERARIARELHDEFGQAILAMRTEIELILSAEPDQNSLLGRRISNLKDLLEQMGREMQRFAYDLRPSVLDDFGLLAAIASLGDRFSEHTGVKVRYNFGGDSRPLPEELELVLYRVAQEGLTNIAKHACATEVNILLWQFKSMVELVIEDNGIGFDPDLVENGNRPGKMGLPGMRERLRVFGGSLFVDSRPGQGTELRAQLSLTSRKMSTTPTE